MFRWPQQIISLFILAIVFAGPAGAISAIEESEKAVGKKMGNYRLIDQDGVFTPFYTFIGHPVLLNFMYTNCVGPCQIASAGISKVRKSLNPELAAQLITVSITLDIDRDKPHILKEFGYGFTDSFESWKFARADEITLEKMIADLGFKYEKTEMGMDHMNRLTLIGPDGIVKKHFYGMNYDPAIVGPAIKAVVEGRGLSEAISDSLGRVLLYCSNYDPITKTYRVDFMFVAIVIFQYLLVMGCIIFYFRAGIARIFMKLIKRGDYKDGV